VSEKQLEDKALIKAAGNGDSLAFETLYSRHKQYVLSVAARYGATGQDALDVLQETFLYFVKKLPGFELRSQFRTFLFPAAKHLSLKKKPRSGHISVEEAPELAASLICPETEEQQRTAVAETVAALPEAQREVVMLRFVDGFSLPEIAEALDIPVGTVKSRLHNALARLREMEKP